MEALSRQIAIFHTISMICLLLFVLMLIIDIFLFIRLDIRSVIGFLTGRTERKTVEQMMSGETSGHLKKDTKKKSALKSKKKKKSKKSSRKRREPTPLREDGDTILTPSGQLKMPGSDEVMLSTGNTPTDVLGENSRTGNIDKQGQMQEQAAQAAASIQDRIQTKPIINFSIEKEIVMIHTDEVLNI